MSQPGLDADEIDAYRERGVVVPRWRLPPGRLAGLRAALDQVIADNRGVVRGGFLRWTATHTAFHSEGSKMASQSRSGHPRPKRQTKRVRHATI